MNTPAYIDEEGIGLGTLPEHALWKAVIERWFQDLTGKTSDQEGGIYYDALKQKRRRAAAEDFFVERIRFRDEICVWAGLSQGATDVVMRRMDNSAREALCGSKTTIPSPLDSTSLLLWGLESGGEV
jgi:hypothetical protein